MRHTQLVNYTLYQIGWFACVLGAARGNLRGLVVGCEHFGEQSAAPRARRSMKSRGQTERLREVARALTGRDEAEEPPS